MGSASKLQSHWDGGAGGDVTAVYGRPKMWAEQDGRGLLKVSSHKDLRLSGCQEMNEQVLLADSAQRSSEP